MLAGTSGSGKSVCIDTVVATVNSHKHHSAEAAPIHVKLHRLYPMVFENLSALFGMVTPEGDWKDGVFSALLRKALQVREHASHNVLFENPFRVSRRHLLIAPLCYFLFLLSLPSGPAVP